MAMVLFKFTYSKSFTGTLRWNMFDVWGSSNRGLVQVGISIAMREKIYFKVEFLFK